MKYRITVRTGDAYFQREVCNGLDEVMAYVREAAKVMFTSNYSINCHIGVCVVNTDDKDKV